MVKLYTWAPTTPEAVLEHTVAPDLGHSALEVVGSDGTPRTYASFWPERDSLIGQIVGLWKHRARRNPVSYAQETDPEDGFMQRPADHEDVIRDLDEAVVVDLWQRIQASEYDFFQWNCASVCKLLVLSALPPRYSAAAQEVIGAVPAGLAHVRDVEQLQTVMRDLASSPFIHSHPDELRRIAQAFLDAAPTPRLSLLADGQESGHE